MRVSSFACRFFLLATCRLAEGRERGIDCSFTPFSFHISDFEAMKLMMLLFSSLPALVAAWSPTFTSYAIPHLFLMPASSRNCNSLRKTIHASVCNGKGNNMLDSSASNRIRCRNDSRFGDGERTAVIIYHKPANVITSHSNMDESPSVASQCRRTVYEDILTMNGYVGSSSKSGQTFEEVTGIKSKLHAIGRLDADTTGALLLTNDGRLVHRITNPNSKDQFNTQRMKQQLVQKTYEAVIMGRHTLPDKELLTKSTIDNPLSILLEKGVALSPKHGGQTRPVDKLSVLSHPTRTTTLVSVTISEGKNRQVRRMFHAVGSGVMKLHRVSVGSISLGELKQGEWRILGEKEILNGLGYECRYLDGDDRGRQGLKRGREINQKRTQVEAQRTKRRKRRR